MNLEGRTTRLRALEPGDIELMYAWENDTEIWGVSGTPISPTSTGSCSEASPRLPMCQKRIISPVETGTTLPEEVAYTRIVSPMA